MATERFLYCPTCKEYNWINRLFDALNQFTEGNLPKCPICGSNRNLELTFDFGLGVGKRKCHVLAAFLPKRIQSWKDENENKIEFYPFLVILEATKRSIWLPYWHRVRKGKEPPRVKYGQWAPHMDGLLFTSLISQAKKYLK